MKKQKNKFIQNRGLYFENTILKIKFNKNF